MAAIAVAIGVAALLAAPAPMPLSVVEAPVSVAHVLVPLPEPPTPEPAPSVPAPIAESADGPAGPPGGPPIDPEPGIVPAIDGTVFADLNGDGIQQVPGEPGMMDILVTLYLVDGIAPGEDALVDQVLTEELGIFYFGFLDNGLYRVEVDESLLPADAARTAPETNPSPALEISLDERTPSVSFGYRQLCSIEGAVWHDADANGTMDEDTNQLGVNDVPVLLERQTGSTTWTVVARQQTGELGLQGRFSFARLAPGNYRVTIDRSGLPAGIRETTLSDAYAFFCDAVQGTDAPSGPPLFGFVQEPSAVHLVGLTAQLNGDGMQVIWETAVEEENLGFHVYRSSSPDAPQTRLNRQLILARGTSVGGIYTFSDPSAAGDEPGWYWLEDVDWRFRHTLHGPVRGTIAF